MWRPFKRSRDPNAPPKERRPSRFGRRAYDPAADAREEPRLAMAGGGDLPPPPDHSPVRAADPYAFTVAHRRLAWMFRLSVMTNVGLIAVAIVQAGAIAELVPLKEIQLGLLRIEPSSDRVVEVDPATRVRIEPITRNVKGYDLLMESFARRYVTLVKPIDPVSQEVRMVEARRFTDPKFWPAFAKERLAEYEKMVKAGGTRSVIVETATRLPASGPNRLYSVDFKQVDRYEKTDEVGYWRAYLTVTAREQDVKDAERFENPLGIRVLAMTVQERGKP